METEHRRRSTRDRPAKPPLSEDAIVDAALAILRAEGLDAVTMRRVAAELDTGAASLYVYVKGRDELRARMLDRVSGTVALPTPDPARWREQIHELLAGWLTAMAAHPGIAAIAVANPPTSERTLLAAENLISLLLLGGATPRDAAWACDILPLIVTMTAIEADVRHEQGTAPTASADRIAAAFAALPVDRFPNLTGYRREMTTGTSEDRFHFAVDVVLDGLVARAGR